MLTFSLPHGTIGDTVLDSLFPHLTAGDIILDAGNEHWQNTERRQGRCLIRGIRYVGIGVPEAIKQHEEDRACALAVQMTLWMS